MSDSLTFWGAAGEVTGSCFHLTTSTGQIVVDVGLFQGLGSEQKNRQLWSMDHTAINSVLLTHAHLDHCGRLPLLAKTPFNGPIWATKPTLDFLPIVLFDSAKLQSRRETAQSPLYSEAEVEKVLSLVRPVEYRTWYDVAPGISARWWDAGHMLGSSSIEIRLKDGQTILFSGDLGNTPSPIVKVSEHPESAATVIMESTYGDRFHPPRGEELKVVAELCQQLEKRQGTLLVPAFSLERTQEFLHIFDHLKRTGEIAASLPVYLDSPMALKATAVFESYPQYFNDHLKTQFQSDDPFDFPGLNIIKTSRESQSLTKSPGPKVIIAGAGMMSGGRVINHAKSLLADKRTIVLINGFQAKGTLGRDVEERLPEVVVAGLKVPLRAYVAEITSMSGHADQNQLLRWLGEIGGVKKIFLVHGEEESRQMLATKLNPMTDKILPAWGQTYKL